MAGHQHFNNQNSPGDNGGSGWDGLAGTQFEHASHTSDQSHTAAQPMYPTQYSTQLSDVSGAPSRTFYLPANSSQTRTQFSDFGNDSAAPISISSRLYHLCHWFERNEHPNEEQISQIATKAGVEPPDVYMFSKFVQNIQLRQNLGCNPPPHGLITPNLTQEMPDGHASTCATTASRPIPASLELSKGPVSDIFRHTHDDRRQDPSQRHFSRGKRPRSADRGQVYGSACEKDYTAKRQLINPPTEVNPERLREADGPYECVSCSIEPIRGWKNFCDHENRCHFPATYFKCRQCEYQCAKADNGKTHLRTALNHRQYKSEELYEEYRKCLSSGQDMFHNVCGFNGCELIFTDRKVSIKHIRWHIKDDRGVRSDWTHRCETRHPFVLSFLQWKRPSG